METNLVDNQDPQEPVDNPDPQPVVSDTPAESGFSWKTQLSGDMQQSPLLQKFDDDIEGLSKAFESHMGLEKMLGHEKVPIPKGADDVEGWNRFSKAMGIPDKAEGYGLADVEVPDALKGLSFDKGKFAELAHAHKLTPGQTQSLWKAYSEYTMDSYHKMIESRTADMTQVVNQLRSEWGDAYESNVEMGQLVINKFASDQDTQDFLTNALVGNPIGAKFLAKIGKQFAENKIGEFKYQNFSLTPDQAQAEIDKIIVDPGHPYNNDKAPDKERQQAIDYVNSLYAAKARQG